MRLGDPSSVASRHLLPAARGEEGTARGARADLPWMPRLRRIALHALAYFAAGAVMSLVIPTLRTFARDQPVTYFRKLDLHADLDWLGDHMPDEIVAALQLKDVDFQWRSD